MAMSALLPVAATADAAPAAAATSEGDVVAAGWQKSKAFSSFAACDRVRSQMVSLGYSTLPCTYHNCGSGCTAPGVGNAWHYYIWR